MKLRNLRIITQVVFLITFCLLFFGFNFFRFDGSNSGLAWFLRLNPFPTIITSIAARNMLLSYGLIALIMIALTIVFGRVFCGMMCPLGTLIDISDRLVKNKKGHRGQLLAVVKLQKLKYVILIGLVVMAVAGLTFPLFMDPLLLITRIFTLLVRPALVFITTPLFEITGVDPETLFSESSLLKAGFQGAITTFFLSAIIFGSSLLDRRFWCQYVCPSGAFFGLLSRFSLLSRNVKNEKCNKCGVCSSISCPTHAIVPDDVEKTNKSECILCGECSAGRRRCSSFAMGIPHKDKIQSPDLGRRELVGSLAVGSLLVPVLRNSGKSWGAQKVTPIRPPGAVEETAFLAKCITCDACISVCPSHALHPATISSDGFWNWNTPKLVPRVGYCIPECTRCSEACPTGALLPLTAEQKSESRIGVAVVNRTRCRAWLGQFQCLVCKKKCPYDAIDEKIIDDGTIQWKVPVVNFRKCTGCGSCEFNCPVVHEAAIQVFSPGERRLKLGNEES